MATLRTRSASRSYVAVADVVEGLARRHGRHLELVDAGRLQCRGDLRVGAERLHLVPQDQVVAHAGASRLPDPVHRLGARRLVVEVHEAVVAAAVPAPSIASTVQKAPRRLPAPKRRSWSKRGPCWPLRSMWKSLSCHIAWLMPCAKLSPPSPRGRPRG